MNIGIEQHQSFDLFAIGWSSVLSAPPTSMFPTRANASPPLSVVVLGRNSRDAVNAALAQNPGYTAGPVRRVSG
jgi:hypothetical protein